MIEIMFDGARLECQSVSYANQPTSHAPPTPIWRDGGPYSIWIDGRGWSDLVLATHALRASKAWRKTPRVKRMRRLALSVLRAWARESMR